MLLRVESLTKQFDGLIAVNKVSFDVNKGEILAIIGPNGAGKSSIFNLISGSLHPTSGNIIMREEGITGLSPHAIARKGVARTFQTTSLFDQLRVADNLAIGHKMRTSGGFWSTLLHAGPWKEDKEKTTAKIMDILSFIGLAGKANNFVSTLSQEEQKRLAIGVALAGSPQIILLDEPTGGLIQEETDGITVLIRKIKAAGVTVCLIEHKMRMVMDLADRIIVLNYGEKLAEGSPLEISSNPEVIEAYLGREYVA